MKKDRVRHSCLLATFTGGAIALLSVHHASAVDRTWDGSASNNWGTGTNWSGDTMPTGTGDKAIFTSTSGSGYSIVLGGADRTVGAIDFNSATSYNLNLYDTNLSTSRTLTLGNITVTAGNHAISGAKPGAGTAGTLKLGTGTFNVASGSTLTFDSRITANGSSSAYDKTGGGTLVLNANNGGGSGWNFTNAGGGFTVSQGTLELAANGVTGNSGNRFTVSSGATLHLSANAFGANNGNLTLNGTGVGGVGALYASENATISDGATASIVLASASRIGVAADKTLTLAQDITGGFALEKSGDGALTLNGTNTYTGDTLVSAGTLYVNGSLASGSDVTVGANGTIGGTGTIASSLTFDSGANLDLTGANLDLTSTGILTVGAGQTMTFTNFQFTDIVGWDWANADNGTYTLINGGGTVSFGANTPTIDDPYTFGNGKFGYFQQGSFQAVIIPEPAAALLGSLGMFFLLRRRRA